MIPLQVRFLIAYIGNFKAQVKKYQTDTGFHIPQLPFSSICREMVQTVSIETVTSISDVATGDRIFPDAVQILQIEAENYIMKYLACKYYISIH